MNKQEFLEALRRALAVLEETEQRDIIDEYEQHIDMKVASGLTEEEAIADFGDFCEMTAELLEAYHVRADYARMAGMKENEPETAERAGGQMQVGGSGQVGRNEEASGAGTQTAGSGEAGHSAFGHSAAGHSAVGHSISGLCKILTGVWLRLWGGMKSALSWSWRVLKAAAVCAGKGCLWCWHQVLRPMVWLAGLLGLYAKAEPGEEQAVSGVQADQAVSSVQAERAVSGGGADQAASSGGADQGASSGQADQAAPARPGDSDTGRIILAVKEKGGVRKVRRGILPGIWNGITAFCRWCADVCIWCVRMTWNACCVAVSLTVGLAGVFFLFVLGMLLILVLGGYPLRGLAVASLGAAMSFFAAAGLAMTILWRKKRTPPATVEAKAGRAESTPQALGSGVQVAVLSAPQAVQESEANGREEEGIHA